jgi:hypothetical protein
MPQFPTRAVILTAGRAVRLRPLIDDRPKGLLGVNGVGRCGEPWHGLALSEPFEEAAAPSGARP